MKDLLLSIIIPVYNIGPWIDRCVESVLPAVPENGEVLLVVGDSSDDSNTRCEAWGKKKTRIKVVHQSGRGLADARNCGVVNSRGTFLLYIDGDDFADTAQLKWLLEQLENMDCRVQVVMTDYRMTDTSGNLIEEINQIGTQIAFSEDQSLMLQVLKKKKCFWNVWRYLYRRDFLADNKIVFLENTLSEDMDYTARVFAAQPVFAFAHCPFYHYCIGRGDSLMDRPSLKRLEDTVAHCVSGVLQMKKTSAAYASAFVAQYQFEYLLNLALCVELVEEDQQAAFALYRATRGILKEGHGHTARLFSYILRICPIPMLAEAFHVMKMLKRALKGNHRRIMIEKGN